jgi:lanthanide-dependent methanol dehydrogenase
MPFPCFVGRLRGAAVVLAWLGCCVVPTGPAAAQASGSNPPPQQQNAPRVQANPAPGDAPGEWRRPSRDFAATRFSPLDQINTDNAKRLRVAWSFSDGIPFGHEAAPLVVGDTMYLVTPFPNDLYALDLGKPGVPIKWTFKPNPKPIAIGKACCDAVNRGAAWADGKIIYNLLDAHTIAVDANTGRELWRTKMDEPANGVTMTMAPLVVGKLAYVGNSGGELGALGWIAALDVDSGKEVWRATSTGPDSMVKIGSDFHPFYDWMRGKDLGVSSWPADMWQHGAGTVWGWITYDPNTDTIFYGTSNPGPRVPEQRPGDNLWTSAIFARDAKTGMAKWAYQFTPHDQWDYDGVNVATLLDLDWNGAKRAVLVTFNRNGFVYTIDRGNGEVLSAKPFGTVNWATAIDPKSARPVLNPAKQAHIGVEVKDICPTHIGAIDWQPTAFSPRTGLLYADMFAICMDLTDHKVAYIAGTPYDGMELVAHADSPHWGAFIAWDPVTGEKRWSIPEQFMTMSGVLVTAGDVAFYGTTDGWFRAVDARDGRVLWSQKLGSGIIGQPITYLGPDKRQYVAIYAGVGGVASQVMGDKPGFPPRGSTLYVFSIDGDGPNRVDGFAETAIQQSQPGATFETPD